MTASDIVAMPDDSYVDGVARWARCTIEALEGALVAST